MTEASFVEYELGAVWAASEVRPQPANFYDTVHGWRAEQIHVLTAIQLK